MFLLKSRAGQRTPRRSPQLGVELLEGRWQPGSVLSGWGFSLPGLSLADYDAGLVTSGEEADQIVHHQLARSEEGSLLANLSGLRSTATDGSRGADTQHSAARLVADNRDYQTAPPASWEPLAGSAASVQLGRLPVSGPLASGPLPMPTALPATPVLQPPAPGSATVLGPGMTPPALPPVMAAGAAATPIPAADLHHLTAAVVTQVGAGGQGEIHPAASVNWTTLVTGTTGAGTGRGVAVDSSGNVYTTGYTDDGTSRMAFVAEYSSSGSRLAFTAFQIQDPSLTYSRSEGHAIALDSQGGIYVVGKATDVLEGDTDAFIMKFQLDANNQLAPVAGYGGGIGGPFDDSAEGLALDPAGEATIVGSYGISPTQSAVFAVKFTSDGSTTIFANFYSFAGYDHSNGTAIALDTTGANAYLAGSIQPSGGDNDILVMQIDNLGGSTVYSYTMPNPGDDILNGIAVDPTGQAYVAGTLAVSGTTQAFVAEVSADGTSIVAQTPLTLGRTGSGIAQDPSSGNVYVVGTGPDSANNLHAFVEKLDSALNPRDAILISGSGTETGSAIAFDSSSGNVYIVGTTTSSDLATDGSPLNGSSDAFLANVGSFN